MPSTGAQEQRWKLEARQSSAAGVCFGSPTRPNIRHTTTTEKSRQIDRARTLKPGTHWTGVAHTRHTHQTHTAHTARHIQTGPNLCVRVVAHGLSNGLRAAAVQRLCKRTICRHFTHWHCAHQRKHALCMEEEGEVG